MATPETPMKEPWPDEAPTDRTEIPPAVSMLLESTSRERCKRCGGRAAARCVGCGEPFCRGCIDPTSVSATDTRCRECTPRAADGAGQSGNLLLEQVLGQVLTRLSASPANPLVNAMRNEAMLCQGEIDSWRVASPSLEARGAMRERVLALHAKVTAYQP